MAVITAIELDDLVTFGKTARQANGGHAGFRAGVAQAHLLHARHRGTDEFRHRHLERIRNAKTGAVLRGLLNRLDDSRVRMAEDRGPPRADVINVLVAIHIPHTRALRLVDEERLPAYGPKCPHGRVDAAGNVFQGLGKKRFGFRMRNHAVKLFWADGQREKI